MGRQMTRKILFLTGTRADFGKLEPLAAAARDAGHAVSFFVTGMHMLDRYGLTRLEVARMPGVAVHAFVNQRPGNAPCHRAFSAACRIRAKRRKTVPSSWFSNVSR